MSLLEIKALKKHYRVGNYFKGYSMVKALDGVDLSLQQGETLAIVGESGCGKSTLARVLMGLEPLTSGEVSFEQKDLKTLDRKTLCSYVQMIFQDPYSSLNPRKRIKDIIAEPLRVHGILSKSEITDKVEDTAKKVGLRTEFLNRFPHMFSGGQRQRIGIARALVLMPKILVCDEPVSALDVSVQAQVLNLLAELQAELKLSYLFISHDLGVVRFLSDRVSVMYLGKVVETAKTQDLFENPAHPYTQLLLQSTPGIRFSRREQSEFKALELPSPLNLPSGCTFHPRCPRKVDRCTTEPPPLELKGPRLVACHQVPYSPPSEHTSRTQ